MIQKHAIFWVWSPFAIASIWGVLIYAKFCVEHSMCCSDHCCCVTNHPQNLAVLNNHFIVLIDSMGQ